MPTWRSLRARLLAVVALPLIVIAGLASLEIRSSRSAQVAADAEVAEIARQEEISEFADALSEERALHYDPTAVGSDLEESRLELNAAVERLRDPDLQLPAEVLTNLESIYAQVESLRSTLGTDQRAISQGLLSGNPLIVDAVESYDPLPRMVLSELGSDNIEDRDALENLTTLLLLERVAESLAVEGIRFQQAIVAEALTEDFVEDTEASVASSDEAIRAAIALGEGSVAAQISMYLDGEQWAAYQSLRNTIVLADEDQDDDAGEEVADEEEAADVEALQGVAVDLDGPTVQQAREVVVDRFEDLENEILATMTANAEDRASAATTALIRTLLPSALLLVAVAGIVRVLYIAIRSPLTLLQVRAEQIASVELPEIVQLMRNDGDLADLPVIEPIPVQTDDEIGRLTHAFNGLHRTAIQLAAEQAASRSIVANMFVNLGRRNQKLLMRMLSALVELEKEETDADRLERLYLIDHLATRMRRNAESLLVLADAGASRRFDHPIPTSELVRAAISEVEDFERVKLSVVEDALIQGDVVADVAHLLAELVENGLKFSAPGDEVEVIARYTRVGYILAVVDRGLGLTADEIRRANQRLATAGQSGETPSRYLGLFVVGRLAARHGMTVELFEGVPAGLIARVRIPKSMLASDLPKGVLDEDAGPSTPPEARERDTEPERFDDIDDRELELVAEAVRSAAAQQHQIALPPAPRRATMTIETPVTTAATATTAGATVDDESLQEPQPPRPPSPSAAGGPTDHGPRIEPFDPGPGPEPGRQRFGESPPLPPAAHRYRPPGDGHRGAQEETRPVSDPFFGSVRRVAGANLPAGIGDDATPSEGDSPEYRSSPDRVASDLAAFQRGVTRSEESEDDSQEGSDQ